MAGAKEIDFIFCTSRSSPASSRTISSSPGQSPDLIRVLLHAWHQTGRNWKAFLWQAGSPAGQRPDLMIIQYCCPDAVIIKSFRHRFKGCKVATGSPVSRPDGVCPHSRPARALSKRAWISCQTYDTILMLKARSAANTFTPGFKAAWRRPPGKHNIFYPHCCRRYQDSRRSKNGK